ncbi:beta-galactosidase [Actinacidiphila yeochonensis]|uniref:beta-galactosidase n=1 Tax=Actinacidiphila yeochonensis TaxID=89050 RepID=UPI0038990173
MWHSAIVPHAGPDSRIFREATATGHAVARLAELAGSTVHAQAAVLHDPDCWWALDNQGLPATDLDYPGTLRRAHRALWDAGTTADLAHPGQDLSRYRLVLAPALPLLSDADAENLRGYVENGGTLLVQHFAGVIDERHHARLGGYPATPLRTALGIRVEEHRPLTPAQTAPLSDGTHGTRWSESLTSQGAEPIATYTDGTPAGQPALTRNRHGRGTAWYLSTRLDDTGYAALTTRLLAESGTTPEQPGLPPGVEAVRRHAPDGRSWLFLLNHTPHEIPTTATGHDLLTDTPTAPAGLRLPPGGAAVLREP